MKKDHLTGAHPSSAPVSSPALSADEGAREEGTLLGGPRAAQPSSIIWGMSYASELREFMAVTP